MLAVSCSILHATTGLMIRVSLSPKSVMLVLREAEVGLCVDTHFSDHLIVMGVATIMLLNRTIKYRQSSSHAVKFGLTR